MTLALSSVNRLKGYEVVLLHEPWRRRDPGGKDEQFERKTHAQAWHQRKLLVSGMGTCEYLIEQRRWGQSPQHYRRDADQIHIQSDALNVIALSDSLRIIYYRDILLSPVSHVAAEQIKLIITHFTITRNNTTLR